MEEQRLDKWLWCSRFFKTRSVAAQAIKSGRVTVNDVKAKPARTVRIGDIIMIRRPPYEFAVTLLGFSKQRVAANQTNTLYEESEASRIKRAELAEAIKSSAIVEDRGGGRLSKKDRRDRDRLKRSF